MRSGIEVPDPAVPGSSHRPAGRPVTDRAVEVADRGRTESKLSYHDPGSPEA